MNTPEPIDRLKRLIEHDRWTADQDARLRVGFREINSLILAELNDRQLSILQSEVGRDSPQFIRAEHEWQRRLQARQLRLMRFAIIASSVSGLVGAVIGAMIRGAK